VVVFCYNRPFFTKDLLINLSLYTFDDLYICIDGAKNNTNDRILVSEVLTQAHQFSNNNKCKLIINNENKGLKTNIESTITSLFEYHSKLIIIEDDVVISNSFFCFMEQALFKFANDKNIGHVTGYNMVPKKLLLTQESNFRLSIFGGSYAWGTWSDRWEKYNPKISFGMILKILIIISIKLKNPLPGIKWVINLLLAKFRLVDTWAWRWFIAITCNKLFCVVPNVNLVDYRGRESGSNLRLKIHYDELPSEDAIFNFDFLPKWDYKADKWRSYYGNNGNLKGIFVGCLSIFYKFFKKYLF
jgi:hypothetical protein